MWLKRILIVVLGSLLKNYIYTIRNGLAYGLKRKGGLGFIPQVRPFTAEEKFLKDLDLNGQIVYDIGGYEGIFTIFFARAVGDNGKVVTFEPNPESYRKILENVNLNKFENVAIHQLALGKEKGKAILAFCPSGLGSASIREDIKTQIIRNSAAKEIRVAIDSLDNQILIHNLPKPNFIKIDVEGLEMDVLLGMSKTIKNCKPQLFIEMHGIDMEKKIENARMILDLLAGNGYAVYHVESKYMIDSVNTDLAKEGHLYCV